MNCIPQSSTSIEVYVHSSVVSCWVVLVTVYIPSGFMLGGFSDCVYTWKISNPAMSSTPMKKFLRAFVSSVLLILNTIHLNIRWYMAFDRAPMEKRTCRREAMSGK